VEVQELHPGLTGQVPLLLLVEAADVLLAFVLLEGVLVAVQLIEDTGVGVTVDRMAGIDQGPRLSVPDEGDSLAREYVEGLAGPILQIKSDNKSIHESPPSRSSEAAYPSTRG
jgi:hypothetical protein